MKATQTPALQTTVEHLAALNARLKVIRAQRAADHAELVRLDKARGMFGSAQSEVTARVRAGRA
jgi:hypothetical protein